MFGQKLSICVATLLFAWNATALSAGPCLSPEACKAIMEHGFQIEYRSLLTSFLSENLYALQDSAEVLREKDISNYVELTAIADVAVDLREIIDNPQELNNEKLTHVIDEIKAQWTKITETIPEQQKHLLQKERVEKAMYTLGKSVTEAWTSASPIAGDFKSQLTGFDAIDADVQKSKDLPFNATNLKTYYDLMSRILQFYGVDNSIIYK